MSSSDWNFTERVAAPDRLEALRWLDRRRAWEERLRQLERRSGHAPRRAVPLRLVDRATA